MQHRLGPDQHGHVGKAPVRPGARTADLRHLETGERGKVVAYPGDPGPDDPWPGRPT